MFGNVLPPASMVCCVVDVDTKFIVPIAVKVIVALALIDRATLPAPAVALPRDNVEVVAAKANVPLACTVKDLPTTLVAEGIVTTAAAGITTSSAAVG